MGHERSYYSGRQHREKCVVCVAKALKPGEPKSTGLNSLSYSIACPDTRSAKVLSYDDT